MLERVHVVPGSMEVLNAPVSVSSIGDNQIVAAVPGKRILVLGYMLDASGGANTVKFRSATTDLTGAMDLVADTPLPVPWSPHGWMITAVGVALNLNLTAATLVAGHVLYGLTDLGPEGVA